MPALPSRFQAVYEPCLALCTGRNVRTMTRPRQRPRDDESMTERPTPTKRTPAHGHGKLQHGNPGNKGGGRYPNWYARFADASLSKKTTRQAIRRILRNPNHPAFAGLLKEMGNRAFGLPKQTIDHTIAERTLEDMLADSYVDPAQSPAPKTATKRRKPRGQ